MLNLIGLLIGNELARRKEVPKRDRAPFALLGAAAPSPVMGAVLVSAALRQRSDIGTGGPAGDGDGSAGDQAPVRPETPRKTAAGRS